MSNILIATIADAEVTAKLKAAGAKEGYSFDMEIGGRVDESAGQPIRIQGTILKAVEGYGQFWVCIGFGRNNVLILSAYLVQIMEPFSLKALGLDIGSFEVIAIKSRVHFRRGFHDNGFAKTILLPVEPEHPFLGTTRLEGLPYRNVDLSRVLPVWQSGIFRLLSLKLVCFYQFRRHRFERRVAQQAYSVPLRSNLQSSLR